MTYGEVESDLDYLKKVAKEYIDYDYHTELANEILKTVYKCKKEIDGLLENIDSKTYLYIDLLYKEREDFNKIKADKYKKNDL